MNYKIIIVYFIDESNVMTLQSSNFKMITPNILLQIVECQET